MASKSNLSIKSIEQSQNAKNSFEVPQVVDSAIVKSLFEKNQKANQQNLINQQLLRRDNLIGSASTTNFTMTQSLPVQYLQLHDKYIKDKKLLLAAIQEQKLEKKKLAEETAIIRQKRERQQSLIDDIQVEIAELKKQLEQQGDANAQIDKQKQVNQQAQNQIAESRQEIQKLQKELNEIENINRQLASQVQIFESMPDFKSLKATAGVAMHSLELSKGLAKVVTRVLGKDELRASIQDGKGTPRAGERGAAKRAFGKRF